MDDIITGHCNHIQPSILGGPNEHSPIATQYSQDSGHPNTLIDNDLYPPPPHLHIYHNLSNTEYPNHSSFGADIEICSNPYCGIIYPPHFFTFDDRSIVIGDPSSDMNHWHHQVLPSSCAVVCQEYILDSFYPDQHFNELKLVELAGQEGYYLPSGGTLPNDVGRILEHYGIEVERSQGNSVIDIITKLENNQKIIVGLDSNEIYSNSESQQLKDLLFPPEANHAVQVIGYDPSRQIFILNDPGIVNGKGFEVTKSDFESAWQDSNYFMMVTKEAPAHDIAGGQHAKTV